jgi:hypothetical protein
MGKNNSTKSNSNSNSNSNNKGNNNSKGNKKNSSSSTSSNSNILFYIIIAVILLFLYSNYVVNRDAIVEEESLQQNKDKFMNVDDHQTKILYLMNRRKCFLEKRKNSLNRQDAILDGLKPKIAKLKQNIIETS